MLIDVLAGFVQELRTAGIPVSMVEGIDAMEALRHTDLGDRDLFKAALGATLVKNARHHEAFDTAFEVYFAVKRPAPAGPDGGDDESVGVATPTQGTGGGGGGEADLEALLDMLRRALRDHDLAMLRAVARRAVETLAGMEPGRPVGGTYYLYRTLRQLDVDGVLAELIDEARGQAGATVSALDQRLLREEMEHRVEQLREEIRSEIRRRLVADRGREAVAKTLRKPLVEDTDLMHATRQDLIALEQIIHPLTRKMAARLAQRRRRRRDGRLDFRRTVRRSLSTGGVPLEPQFRAPRPSKPEVMLLCDISGSMATFARFTLQFVYAMRSQFSKLRAFAFIDALDEVTGFFEPGADFGQALHRVSTEAEVVWMDGHSDYGRSLEQFWERYAGNITARTTIIVTGDARNNYRDPRSDVLVDIADISRAVYWLNPEPSAYWNTGDSVMERYAGACTAAWEVRNLRQLERFVEHVALPGPSWSIRTVG